MHVPDSLHRHNHHHHKSIRLHCSEGSAIASPPLSDGTRLHWANTPFLVGVDQASFPPSLPHTHVQRVCGSASKRSIHPAIAYSKRTCATQAAYDLRAMPRWTQKAQLHFVSLLLPPSATEKTQPSVTLQRAEILHGCLPPFSTIPLMKYALKHVARGAQGCAEITSPFTT